ncbi:MAG: hypothetical protein DI551_12590 [Micavibrio aeruginosavorus]|jgi:hypothetical protein|uniref:Uncharacterized protein n=1 Tax=Micavibrio aeruginosavorus TaxID=349221 RepID=A0A2W5MWY8_9BACT|nr:MAG: hypothetical protein DI551_12590 [Micavibrio aeruginosavorus]
MRNRYNAHQTPASDLLWWNLSDWVEAARTLDARRASWRKNVQRIFHVRALPLKMVWDERSLETLQDALDLLTSLSSGFRQPPRGQRENAPHTPLIAAIKNRMKQIEREQDRDSIPDGHNRLTALRSFMTGFFA